MLHTTDTKSKVVLTTFIEAGGNCTVSTSRHIFFHAFRGSKNLSRADLLWYVGNLQSPKIVARSQQPGEVGEIPIGWSSSQGRERNEHVPEDTSHTPSNFGV